MKRLVLPPVFYLSAVFLAVTLSPAQADQCMEHAQDQVAMTDCAAQAYQTSDAELNRLFQEIRQRLADNRDAQHLLRESQRAWIAFRDAECRFAASGVGGGSIYPMIYSLCLGDLTRKRVEELWHYLNCAEGDLSCPVPSAG